MGNRGPEIQKLLIILYFAIVQLNFGHLMKKTKSFKFLEFFHNFNLCTLGCERSSIIFFLAPITSLKIGITFYLGTDLVQLEHYLKKKH